MQEGMNANERRIFNQLKQRVYNASKGYYEEAGSRLTLQERMLVDYFAGTYVTSLMEALKNAESKNESR